MRILQFVSLMLFALVMGVFWGTWVRLSRSVGLARATVSRARLAPGARNLGSGAGRGRSPIGRCRYARAPSSRSAVRSRDAARHKSKRDVERLIASLVPQPDIVSSLRRVPSAPVRKSARVGDEGALALIGHTDTAAPVSHARLEPPSTKSTPEATTERAAASPRAVVPPHPAAPRHSARLHAPSWPRSPRIATASKSP